MRAFLILLIILVGSAARGQEHEKISQLKNALAEQHHDTVRVRLLNELALEYKASDTTLSYELLKESLELSVKNNFDLGKGGYYESLGKIYYYQGQYERAIRQFEEARTLFKKSGNKLKMAGVIVDEGNANLFLSRFDNALERYQTAHDIFKTEDHTYGLIRCLNNMGIIYKNFGEYEKALKSYEAVVQLYLDNNDPESLGDTYINIGVVFVLQGFYQHALENFNKALTLAEEAGNLKQQTICLMNSGVIHNKMGEYARALDYYTRALEVSKRIGDKVEISKCLTNIGTNYISMGRYQLAEDYINRGLEIKIELGDRKSIANCYNFLAEINYHQTDFAEALKLDQMAVEIKSAINDPEGMARVYGNMSRTYLALNDHENALLFADSSLSYALAIGALEHITTAYTYKKEVMAKTRQFEKAYELSELSRKYNDSLLNEHKVKAVNEIEFRYQSRVLEEENKHLRVQTEMDYLLIKRHRKIIVYFLLALVMVCVTIVLLYVMHRKQQHYNSTLEKKNQIITKQNIKLDTLNRTKDKILSVITHDLRGTIGNQLTALSLLAREEFKNEQERKVVFSRLANSATLSLGLLENLALWTKIQEEALSYLPEEGYINQTLTDVLELFQESLGNKELALINDIKGEYPCFYDHFMIKSVLKNLISNAIKFSDRGGEIRCEMSAESEFVRISITNNGNGLTERETQMLIKGNISKMRRGTENEKGSGLGLYIVKTFLDFHNSKLRIDSAPLSGTCVSFLLSQQRPR